MLNKAVRRAVHLAALVTRPMTLGARVLVRDESDRVLLIEHTYVPGWYLPGGGVDRGETMVEAARRELREETGIACGDLSLFGLYFNRKASPRDHVGLFLARDWNREFDVVVPNREIRQIGFFRTHRPAAGHHRVDPPAARRSVRQRNPVANVVGAVSGDVQRNIGSVRPISAALVPRW